MITASRFDYKYDTKSRTFIYRYNRQTKMWEKLVDSANYYSPYKKQDSSIQASPDLSLYQADFTLEFRNWDDHRKGYGYPLVWNDNTQNMEYGEPYHIMVDTN